jgi:hypothetical protein
VEVVEVPSPAGAAPKLDDVDVVDVVDEAGATVAVAELFVAAAAYEIGPMPRPAAVLSNTVSVVHSTLRRSERFTGFVGPLGSMDLIVLTGLDVGLDLMSGR